MNPPTSDGGSPIISYELQVYDLDIGLWVSLIGNSTKKSLTTEFLFSQSTFGKPIVKGRTYVFKYRALNINGAGLFSDEGYLTAAQRPGSPPAPQYVSSTNESITLNF